MKMNACNVFRVNGLAMVIGAMGVTLLAATFAQADICTDPQDAEEYDASIMNAEPNYLGSIWSLVCLGENGIGSLDDVVNGILEVRDDDDMAKAKYCTRDLFEKCMPRQDAVYEFSCKAISSDGLATAWVDSTADHVYTCGMASGSNGAFDHDFRVAISTNEGVGFFKVDGTGDVDWLDLGSGQLRVAFLLTKRQVNGWITMSFELKKMIQM